MFLYAAKTTPILLWLTLGTAILHLLFPSSIPLLVPLAVAAAWAGLTLFMIFHIVATRRREWRCPHCGWIPFALKVWKCKQCRFVWDSFATGGVCPRCQHAHEETACFRCRQISPILSWQ
jgi:hypothetical protein